MRSLLATLTPQQIAVVTFLATFVTVIGALAVAWYFRRANRRAA